MTDSERTARTVLVTGANSGLGRATAAALAARGERVVLAARSEARTRPVLEDLRARFPAAELRFLELDLANLAAVRRAAEAFRSSEGRLDVLINNAGTAGGRGLTDDGFEITVGTNHVGAYHLTELLLPCLRAAPQGRIVNVASVAHTRVRELDWHWLDRRAPEAAPARSGFGAYAVSKLMNILHARALARRLSGTRVTTYALHPGGIATNIWRSLPWFVRQVLALTLTDAEHGAETQVWCATAPELAAQTGRYYERCAERTPTALARDDALADELDARTARAIALATGGVAG